MQAAEQALAERPASGIAIIRLGLYALVVSHGSSIELARTESRQHKSRMQQNSFSLLLT